MGGFGRLFSDLSSERLALLYSGLCFSIKRFLASCSCYNKFSEFIHLIVLSKFCFSYFLFLNSPPPVLNSIVCNSCYWLLVDFIAAELNLCHIFSLCATYHHLSCSEIFLIFWFFVEEIKDRKHFSMSIDICACLILLLFPSFIRV